MVAVAETPDRSISVATRCTDLSALLASLSSCTRYKLGPTNMGKFVGGRANLTLAIFLAGAGFDSATSGGWLDAYS